MYVSTHDRDDFDKKTNNLELIPESHFETEYKYLSKFNKYILNTVGTPHKANWYLADLIANLFWISIFFSLNGNRDYPCRSAKIVDYSNSVPLWYIQLTILTAILVMLIRLHELYEAKNKSDAGRTLYISLFAYGIYALWLLAFWIYQIYVITNIYKNYQASVGCDDQISLLVINFVWVTIMVIFRVIVPIVYSFI